MVKMKAASGVLVVLGLGVLCTGAYCQQGAAQNDAVMQALNHGVDSIAPSPTDSLQRRETRYQVENSDVLDLQFVYTPDFNQTVTVQPDGFITVKEIGDVHVAGDTVPQIQSKLQQAYSGILAKPVITVFLREFEKPYFLALGEVGHPGKFELHGVTTVASAVALAGGFTADAKHSEVLLFRRVNNNWDSVTKVNLKHMLKSQSLAEDLQVQPGDLVYVPKNTVSKVKAYVPAPTIGTYGAIP